MRSTGRRKTSGERRSRGMRRKRRAKGSRLPARFRHRGMSATRAYIASAGTAVVLLGASFCMFVLVSAFVAFGSWPGTESHTNVDSVILSDVAKKPKAQKVAV